jgi:GNAT superfamily N-acetyltransferase
MTTQYSGALRFPAETRSLPDYAKVASNVARMPVGMSVTGGRIDVGSSATLRAATSRIYEVGGPMSEQSDARAVAVNVMMRRPTLVGLPAMPILAAPLAVRRAHVAEAGALAALLGRAFPSEHWDTPGTARELFCDETVRATLVVADEGRPVATASVQVRPDLPECGWVRWVATDLDRRREGLARALVVGVLAIAEHAGCREARLRTHTYPLAAIPLYLQLGFEPLVMGDSDRAVWERVMRLVSTSTG